MPSPETLTLVPEFQPPPSTEYCVFATPEPPSLGLRATVVAPDCQPAGALFEVSGRRVVDAPAGDDGRRGRVARDVGDDDPQVVDAVRHRGRRPGLRDARPDAADQRLVHDHRHAGGDRRPGRVVDDRAEVDGAAEVRAGVVQRGRRRRVVDPPRADRRALGDVAGDVGRDRAEEVEAVRQRGRVERRLVRIRVVRADRRPGGAVGADLEDDVGDARAGVARGALDRDDARASSRPGRRSRWPAASCRRGDPRSRRPASRCRRCRSRLRGGRRGRR